MKSNIDDLKQQAVSLLQEACCDFGILASPDEQDNYRRLWSRDSMIAGIAGMLVEDEEILNAFKLSIRTLSEYQHPYGMIPSNVLPDKSNPEVSYGGLAGRVDATTWFIVGTCLYLIHLDDEEKKKSLYPNLLQALEILDRWEFNGNGLLYTPLSGNWADEYPIEGHTLYDNLLRAWGLKLYGKLFDDRGRDTQADVILERIAINFWPDPNVSDHPAVYHRRCFLQACKNNQQYFACSVDPKGYNMHFDAAGHGLALMLGISRENQQEKIKRYVNVVFDDIGSALLPAFWPIIKPETPEWNSLKQNYNFNFKNNPHHFHNGGIWPVWMGFFALGMSKVESTEITEQMLEAWMSIEDPDDIGFAEYIASDSLEPCGKQRMSYSASGMIFLLEALNQNSISKLYTIQQ